MVPWKLYEIEILTKFRKEFPKADIKANRKLKGVLSQTDRQIDILVTGAILGHTVLGVVECKYFNKKVDIKTIDGFIGFLEDVQANLGIIITNKGFTKAAKNAADLKKIRIEIIEFEKLDVYHFNWDSCEACDYNDVIFSEVEWHTERIGKCKSKVAIMEGNCSNCGTTHIKCNRCNSVMCIWEADYGNMHECMCGNNFVVEHEYVGSGMNEDVFYAICNKKKIELKASHLKTKGDL